MTENTAVAEVEAPQVEVPEAPETEAPTADVTPDAVPPAPAPTAPAPRTGNAAWATEDQRKMVKKFMDALREAGYTRPELSAFTDFNDSTVWRAQNLKVHTHEVEHWMETVFKPFTDGTLPPAAKSLKAPKPEVLQAKIDAIEAKIAQAVEALANPEVKTVKEFRALVADVTAALSA